jgi:hypothetical protein
VLEAEDVVAGKDAGPKQDTHEGGAAGGASAGEGPMNTLRIAAALSALNLAILAGAAIQARPAGAQGAEGVLRGRVIELVDQRGQTRARLDVEPGGEVVLRLLDQQGTIRVKLGAGMEGSGLLLANDATEPGVHILAKATGSSIRVVNKDGRERVIAP